MVFHRHKPNRPGHGKTTLAWGVLLFGLGQMALAMVEHYRPVLRDPEYAYRAAYLHARLAAHPERPLLLVTGSSRVTTGFRPEHLPELRTPGGRAALVFNCAIPSSGPVRELLYLRRLLAEGVRPRWLVVECWPPLMHQRMGEAEVDRLDISRLGWADLGVLRRYTSRPHFLYRRWWGSWLLPAFSNRFTLLTALTPAWLPHHLRQLGSWLTMDRTGWLPQPVPTDPAVRERMRADTRKGFKPLVADFRLSVRADRALRELLTICRREHIAAALLFMPEGKGFRDWYEKATFARFRGYLAALGREYQVPVIDTRLWVSDAGFSDGFHLVPRSAAAFTRRFGREALQPFLEGKLLPAGQGNQP
jgi:hypothetical protein